MIPFLPCPTAATAFCGTCRGWGKLELGANHTRWLADAARQLDYWVTTAPTPAEIVTSTPKPRACPPCCRPGRPASGNASSATATQEELLAVARKHKRRGLPLSVIVVDYFHWSARANGASTAPEWPDPQAMVQRTREMGVELMVSVWPTVNPNSENHAEMDRRGLLVGNVRGLPLTCPSGIRATRARCSSAFTTRPTPRPAGYVWDKFAQGYRRYGIPGVLARRLRAGNAPRGPRKRPLPPGPGQRGADVYPREHARGFVEGLGADGEKDVMLLCRSAWAGSQRYGAAVWSGDIDSTFEALAAQIPAGLNIGISGHPMVDHRHRRV